MVAGTLDLGLLQFFVGIFIFLLTFVITYGFLTYRKLLGEGKEGLYGLISLAIAVIVVAARPAAALIAFLAPWFFLMIFLAFFGVFILSIFGLDISTLGPTTNKGLRNTVITVSVILLIFGLSTVFGQETLEAGPGVEDGPSQVEPANTSGGDGVQLESPDTTNTGEFSQNFVNTLTHPKVLGLIAFMLIVSFAMFFLTSSPSR